jgi:gamma-glutamyl hercynylcysteine S-oxide synthase
MVHPSELNILAAATPPSLGAHLRESRARCEHLTADLSDDKLLGPQLAIVNPPLWEIGHVAWFQEYWCLRYRGTDAPAPSILANADALYDSAKVAHNTRWSLPLPGIEQTRTYGANVLERVVQRLEREPDNKALQYFARLALFHEDMHAEAFYYTRQTLSYSNPFPHVDAGSVAIADCTGDVAFAGGTFRLGAEVGPDFVFDNEKWAHEVLVSPFHMARAAVTNADYLAFVDCGGYTRREWWDDDGWNWRETAQLQAPRYWTRQNDTWRQRRFDTMVALRPHDPVIHVNWHEAQAYCRFAGRRLPTEAEWEYAAAWDAGTRRKRRFPWGDAEPGHASANLESTGVIAVDAMPLGDTAAGCRQMMGNVWEWTASTFNPYPGYIVDPYKEYSQPWFGTHKVLRGGSFATTRRLMRNTWRNFYTPERGDIFAGFRTCAIERAG